MEMRIVHVADLHLDIPFSSLGRTSQTSNARREGLRQTLKRALELAREWSADALTIGGDLYEAEHISPDTAQFLRQQFENAAPLRIFISPGNHDPYTRSSPYAYIDWPNNVHFFCEPQITPVALDKELVLWGAAHNTPAFTTNLLNQFRLPDSRPALLLLHGTDCFLSLGQNKGAFCPFSESEVRAAGFGLALLGHIHHQRLQPTNSPFLCYPGSPEPLGFDEEEGHSVLLVEWVGNQWRVETRDISRWVCRSAQVDVSSFKSHDAVIERIRQLWIEERQGKQCLARISLEGQPEKSLDLDLQVMRTALRSDFAEIYLHDKTVPPFDIEALKQDTTVTGAFVRRMLKEAEVADRSGDQRHHDIVGKALKYGLMALENQEIRGP
jgi:DNA repair protein SbcD/Mre11